MDKELVKKLRSMTGFGLMECKKVLIAYNGDIDKAVKYLRHFPMSPPMDFWQNKKYRYCPQCDRFYVVKRNINECEVCGNILE